MSNLKHIIPLGTRVSFEGDVQIYVTDSYQEVLGPCRPDCTIDHDHFDEAHIMVRKNSWTSLPLSKLSHVFDQPEHRGREASAEEKTPCDF